MSNSRTDVVPYLRGLERNGEDNIWRTAQQAREEIERLRTALRDVLQSDVGRQTQHKLADGHGTETDDGRAWLAAALLIAPTLKLKSDHTVMTKHATVTHPPTVGSPFERRVGRLEPERAKDGTSYFDDPAEPFDEAE